MISIHASREGSDRLYFYLDVITGTFQSTLPAREATKEYAETHNASIISIHASREGSDFVTVAVSDLSL